MRHRRRLLLALAALAAAPLLAGCPPCDDHPSAECGPAPTAPLATFRVTTRTGSDSSDADIQLCLERRGRAQDDCHSLETPADDFEDGQIDVFDVYPVGPVDDLEGFYLYNGGGAFLGNDEWEIEGVTLEATTLGGDRLVLYDEPQLGCGNSIDEGERWYPAFCVY